MSSSGSYSSKERNTIVGTHARRTIPRGSTREVRSDGSSVWYVADGFVLLVEFSGGTTQKTQPTLPPVGQEMPAIDGLRLQLWFFLFTSIGGKARARCARGFSESSSLPCSSLVTGWRGQRTTKLSPPAPRSPATWQLPAAGFTISVLQSRAHDFSLHSKTI